MIAWALVLAGAIAEDSASLRAAQVFVFPGTTDAEISREVGEIRKAGANVLILRAFHMPGDRYHGDARGGPPSGVYFATREAPVVSDLLGRVVRIGHASGLQVWAWMSTRKAPWRPPGDRRYDPEGGGFVPAEGLLDLAEPGARAHLRRLYADLAAAGPDGVLFQDDLVIRQAEGWGEATATRLARERFGGKLPPMGDFYRLEPTAGGKRIITGTTDLFREVALFRRDLLLETATELAGVVRGARPGAVIALNLDYDTLWAPQGALRWLGQDAEAAARAGFDYLAVMAYHRQIAAETGRTGRERDAVLAAIGERAASLGLPPARILIKLQTIDWKTRDRLAVDELERIAGVFVSRAPFSFALAPCDGRNRWPPNLLRADGRARPAP